VASQRDPAPARRELIALAGAAAGLGATAAQATEGAEPASPRTRPNVPIFFTDQQRWDTCGCYGETPLDLTPNLDRMARRGTLLRHSFTCQPVCAPARGSFQTGLYATHPIETDYPR
jgi:hypothetical protein